MIVSGNKPTVEMPSSPLSTRKMSVEYQQARHSTASESTIVTPTQANPNVVLERPYSRKLFYRLNIPIFIINVTIIALTSFIAADSPRVGSRFGFEGHSVLLSAASVSLVYNAILMGITFWGPHIPIPALVRILVNSLIVIPLWIGAVVTAVVLMVEGMSSGPLKGACPRWTGQSGVNDSHCWAIIRRLQTITWVASALGIFAVILAVIDFGYSVSLDREKRVMKRRLTEKPNNEPSYPNKIFYSLHIPIAVLLVASIVAASWTVSDNVQRLLWGGPGALWPAIMLSASALALVWTCVLFGLQAEHIHVPALARILVNSLCVIPYLWIGAGLQIAFLQAWYGKQGCHFWYSEVSVTPYDQGPYRQQCDDLWLRIDIANCSSAGLGLLASILYIADLIYSIRLRRQGLRMRQVESSNSQSTTTVQTALPETKEKVSFEKTPFVSEKQMA